MDEPISVATPDTSEPISVDTTPPNGIPIGAEIAGTRAFKAKVGLPQLPYSYDDMFQAMIGGNETQTRQFASDFANYQKSQYKVHALNRIAQEVHGPLTDEEHGKVWNLLNAKPETNPQSVFEEYYSKSFLDSLKNGVDWWPQNEEGDRDFFRGHSYMAMQEVMRTFVQNAEQKLKAQGTAGWLLDEGLSFIPGFSAVRRQGIKGLYKLGDVNEAEAASFYKGDPQANIKRFLEKGNKMLEGNPKEALAWGQSMLDQSYDQKLMANLGGLLDLPIGGAVKLGANALARRAIVSTVKEAGKETASKAAMAEAVGDVKEAAIQRATTRITANMNGTGHAVDDSLKSIPEIWNPYIESLRANTGKYSEQLVRRLVDRAEKTKAAQMDTIANTAQVNRTAAVEQEMRKLAEDMDNANLFPGLENRVLNITPRKEEGIGLWAEYHFGEKGLTLFKNLSTAQKWAKKSGFPNAEFEDTGTGWVAKVSIPVDETKPFVRDSLVSKDSFKTPRGNYLGALTNRYRTPNESLSKDNVIQREAATYGLSNYHKLIEENAKDILNLRTLAVPGTKKREIWN